MDQKHLKAIGLGVLGCAAAVGIFLLCKYKDMTGAPYSEIEAYKQAHPNKIVTYTVTIEGGEKPLKLDEKTAHIVLTNGAQASALAEYADYLQHAQSITLNFAPTHTQLLELRRAFHHTNIVFDSFTLNGVSYPADCTALDLSGFARDNLTEAIELLQALPALETVELMGKNGSSKLSLDDVLQLQKACPNVLLRYTFDLFGQSVSTDAEELYYFQTHIGDAGLDEIRKIMPLMKNLTYLRLDTCDTSNEATAALREELKDKCKVVWRVFFGQNDALTDTYKIWATWNVDTKEVACLQYCNEVKYLDLGHNSFMNLDFMSTMTELEMAIVAIGNLYDISGIANCTKLEFLEIFSNRQLTDEDMQHLSALTNMKYLNISNTILMRDLSFTDSMPKLRKLWNTLSRVPQAEIDRVKALHPDCEFVFLYDGDPTDYGWRYTYESGYQEMTPEYALVRARFGYSDWDFSRGEKGYLREEITYESLGLTPT